jgi:hypothetical protein
MDLQPHPVPDPDARLKDAATRLRTLTNAVPPEPWTPGGIGDYGWTVHMGNPASGPYESLDTRMDSEEGQALTRYIAAMGPGVAAAAVSVLEQAAARLGHYQAAAARIWDTDDPQQLADAEEWLSNRIKRVGPALALADAILGAREDTPAGEQEQRPVPPTLAALRDLIAADPGAMTTTEAEESARTLLAAHARELAEHVDGLAAPDCADMSSLDDAWECGNTDTATALRQYADGLEQQAAGGEQA